MTIQVDIADRLYDYTDEEKAAEAVAAFQTESGLNDDETVALWSSLTDPRRAELERLIYEAVDDNGSAKRARETIANGISLTIEENV